MKIILISFLLASLLLASCVSHISEKELNTIYVANDYIIFQDQRYQNFKELNREIECKNTSEIFISPLVETPTERFSEATAEFMMVCGGPKVIKIQISE